MLPHCQQRVQADPPDAQRSRILDLLAQIVADAGGNDKKGRVSSVRPDPGFHAGSNSQGVMPLKLRPVRRSLLVVSTRDCARRTLGDLWLRARFSQERLTAMTHRERAYSGHRTP